MATTMATRGRGLLSILRLPSVETHSLEPHSMGPHSVELHRMEPHSAAGLVKVIFRSMDRIMGMRWSGNLNRMAMRRGVISAIRLDIRTLRTSTPTANGWDMMWNEGTTIWIIRGRMATFLARMARAVFIALAAVDHPGSF